MLHEGSVGGNLLNEQHTQSSLFILTSYLEALMENFPIGAVCLQEQLVEGKGVNSLIPLNDSGFSHGYTMHLRSSSI